MAIYCCSFYPGSFANPDFFMGVVGYKEPNPVIYPDPTLIIVRSYRENSMLGLMRDLG